MSKIIIVSLILVLLSNYGYGQDSHTTVNTLKYLDYYSKSSIKTADIDGRWGIKNDRIRIDYGLMKLNSSIVELKILNSIEIGEKLNLKCRDVGSMEDVDVWIYPDPKNEKKPILELDLKFKKQYLQFSFQDNEGIKKRTFFYTNLSPVLDYKIDVQYPKITNVFLDKKSLTITVYKKSGTLTARIENIEFDSYKDINDFRAGSMITSTDIDGGEIVRRAEFIIADFNFDGLSDFAIKEDEGGNHDGAFYKYFLQRNDETYHLDDYLTNKVGIFPVIDKINKCLSLTTLRDMGQFSDTYYFRYNWTLENWELFQTREDEHKHNKVENVGRGYDLTESRYSKFDETTKKWKIFRTEIKPFTSYY